MHVLHILTIIYHNTSNLKHVGSALWIAMSVHLSVGLLPKQLLGGLR